MANPEEEDRFRPTQTASHVTFVLGAALGPLAWAVALFLALRVGAATNAIRTGLVIALFAWTLATVALVGLRVLRVREERRYVDGP